MSAHWLFASPAERRLLGDRRLRGPTPWLIGIMSFSMLIVAAAGLALANTAALLAGGAAGRYSVQIPGGSAPLAAAAAIVRSTPGVQSVETVPEKEMRQTLERWLGPAGANSDLPVPGLLNFDAGPGLDTGSIERRVRAVAPDARLIAHRQSVAPLLDSLRALQALSVALVLMLAAAAAAAVVLAVRGALDTHRFTIEVMHGIGATDHQVTRLFQRKIAIESALGSLAGAAAASLVLILIAAGATFARELVGGATLSAADIAALALIPVALTLVATWVARAAALRALRGAV